MHRGMHRPTIWSWDPDPPPSAERVPHPSLPACHRLSKHLRLTFSQSSSHPYVHFEVVSRWQIEAPSPAGSPMRFVAFDEIEHQEAIVLDGKRRDVTGATRAACTALGEDAVTGRFAGELAYGVFWDLAMTPEPAPWMRQHFPGYVAYLERVREAARG